MRITHDDLFDIMAEASHRLHQEIRSAFKMNNLEGYLASIDMHDLYPVSVEPQFDTDPEGKILLVGQAQIKENQIIGCFEELGIARDRVELRLGYEELKNYSFKSLQYNYNYRLVLFGPIPHSGKDKGDASSIITQLETTDGYPRVVRLEDSHGLKITRTSLKRALKKQIDSDYLAI